MKNQFKNFSKLGYLGMIALLFAALMVACKQDQDIMPEDAGKLKPTFSTKSAATCDFDANRFMRLSHLHQKARVTTQGVTNFTNQLHEAPDGAIVNVGSLRFTAPGGEVEVGGGEGYGVTTQPLDGNGNNPNKRKLINNGESLIIQTRNTSDEILKAVISFKSGGGTNGDVTIKASKGNRCVGEQIFDLTGADAKTVEVCFGQSFTKLEITADDNSDGITIISNNQKISDVWVNFPTIFYVGTQTFVYDLMAGPFGFQENALSFISNKKDGSTKLNASGEATTTMLGWHTEYGNDDCDGTGNVKRYYLRRQDTGEYLAGVAGNNGLRDPNRIFTWQRDIDDSWAFNVPFVLIRKYHGRSFKPAIITPRYEAGYPNPFNQTKFEAPVGGVATFTDAEGTNWEARQGDKDGNNMEQVYIFKNGRQWGRTGGSIQQGTLEGFTVLPVRKALTDINGNVQNVYEYVGFALIQQINPNNLANSRGLTLQTRLRGNGWFMGPIQEQLSF